MIKKVNWSRVGIISFTIVFLITAVTFEIFELASLPGQFFGTLLGVVITAIITVLLLQGQTKSEETRERHIMVFEKKQEIYFEFLNKLNTILQKDSLALHLTKDKVRQNEVHNLHDLLFEFGYLQMHTSAETFDKILDYVGNLMQESKMVKSIDENAIEDLERYYSVLTTDFFAIVSLLQYELYKESSSNMSKEKIDRIIKLSF